MSYENAPSTKMLATRCAVCRRALRDAVSVEIGMGPDCRKNHGYAEIEDASEEARTAANKLIHQCSLSVRMVNLSAVVRHEISLHCAALRLMGFRKVADRIEYRGKDAPISDRVTIKEYDLPALPGTWKRGRWLNARPAVTGYLVTAPYKPTAVDAFRNIPGRRWLKEQKATFIPKDGRESLWSLLRDHYAGLTLTSDCPSLGLGIQQRTIPSR